MLFACWRFTCSSKYRVFLHDPQDTCYFPHVSETQVSRIQVLVYRFPEIHVPKILVSRVQDLTLQGRKIQVSRIQDSKIQDLKIQAWKTQI